MRLDMRLVGGSKREGRVEKRRERTKGEEEWKSKGGKGRGGKKEG